MRKNGLTRIDVAVLACCLIVVTAGVRALSAGGRSRAKELVCLSNLRVWGEGFIGYTNDNNGYFMTGWIGHGWVTKPGWVWYWALIPYVGDSNELQCCPEAAQPAAPYGNGTYPAHAAWYIQDGSMGGVDMTNWGYRVGDRGSYMVNRFINNTPVLDQSGRPFMGRWLYRNPDPLAYNWRTANIEGASNVPVLLDGDWVGGNPGSDDCPREAGCQSPDGDDMQMFSIDRHNGYVNGLFMDFSARKIGLKELWTLKWHRQYDTCGPWTKCGGAEPNDWPRGCRAFRIIERVGSAAGEKTPAAGPAFLALCMVRDVYPMEQWQNGIIG